MVLEMQRVELSDAEIASLQLDEILEMSEPRKTNVLRQWLNTIDEKHMGQVLVKANRGSTFTATYRNRPVKVPPRGVRVDRRIAVELLNQYGKNGIYYGMDQETGMTPSRWRGMSPEQRERYDREPNFIDRYLTHIPDTIESLANDEPEFPEVDDEE